MACKGAETPRPTALVLVRAPGLVASSNEQFVCFLLHAGQVLAFSM